MRSSGGLRAEAFRVDCGLLDCYGFPRNFEFLGDYHGKERFNSLADFRIFGGDDDRSVRFDLNERVGRKFRRIRFAVMGGLGSGASAERKRQYKSAASDAGHFQELAARDKAVGRFGDFRGMAVLSLDEFGWHIDVWL